MRILRRVRPRLSQASRAYGLALGKAFLRIDHGQIGKRGAPARPAQEIQLRRETRQGPAARSGPSALASAKTARMRPTISGLMRSSKRCEMRRFTGSGPSSPPSRHHQKARRHNVTITLPKTLRPSRRARPSWNCSSGNTESMTGRRPPPSFERLRDVLDPAAERSEDAELLLGTAA